MDKVLFSKLYNLWTSWKNYRIVDSDKRRILWRNKLSLYKYVMEDEAAS